MSADSDTYIEAECQTAVGAAEAVAAARGRPAPEAPEALLGWAAHNAAPSGDLVTLAKRAIDRILAGSELKELWDEAGREGWQASMAELRQRLD